MIRDEAEEILHSKLVSEITPEMIEAGARELLLYDEFSARREVAEAVLRSALKPENRRRP